MLKKTSLNLKIFLSSFFLSLPFWWGMNIFQNDLENILFEPGMTGDPQIFTAQIVLPKELIIFRPARNWRIESLKIEGESAISVLIDSRGNEEILFEKNADEELPIASLTKIMTADIISKNYEPSGLVEISQRAVKEEGNSGEFKTGEILTVENLLYSLLMESSNDAAIALTEVIGEEPFVALMNLQAKTRGMENTYFVNSTGLDPDNPSDPVNYSTVKDLVKLTNSVLKTDPRLFEISSLLEYDLYSPDGIFHHKLINTDELLKEFENIIGSKTGWTPQAQGCLLLIVEAPDNRGIIINVILGSPERFKEMKKLINWLGEAYQW